MSELDSTYAALPDELQRGLEALCAALSTAVGDDLLSVAVYGGVAKGDPFVPGKTPVQVLVVLEDASVEHLRKIAPDISNAAARLHVAPFVVSLQDLRTSTDIFPVKFQDMQANHILLAGRDVLSELEISSQHLRLRCEQELCNLMMRLRNLYLRNARDQSSLQAAVQAGISPFFTTLGASVGLVTGLTPLTEPEIAESAVSLMSLDQQALNSLLEFEASEAVMAAEDVALLLDAFLGVVQAAALFVDQIDESSLPA